MPLYAKEQTDCQSTASLEWGMGQILFHSPQEEPTPRTSWFRTSSLRAAGQRTSWFKPPSLRCFIMAVLTNWCNLSLQVSRTTMLCRSSREGPCGRWEGQSAELKEKNSPRAEADRRSTGEFLNVLQACFQSPPVASVSTVPSSTPIILQELAPEDFYFF